MEGMTYRSLLDRVRFDMASKMLSEAQRSIREIARDLGYSGTNNLVRAFRRMAAMTPAEYRCRQLESS
jgi:AraC-like DNA-binding protein